MKTQTIKKAMQASHKGANVIKKMTVYKQARAAAARAALRNNPARAAEKAAADRIAARAEKAAADRQSGQIAAENAAAIQTLKKAKKTVFTDRVDRVKKESDKIKLLEKAAAAIDTPETIVDIAAIEYAAAYDRAAADPAAQKELTDRVYKLAYMLCLSLLKKVNEVHWTIFTYCVQRSVSSMYVRFMNGVTDFAPIVHSVTTIEIDKNNFEMSQEYKTDKDLKTIATQAAADACDMVQNAVYEIFRITKNVRNIYTKRGDKIPTDWIARVYTTKTPKRHILALASIDLFGAKTEKSAKNIIRRYINKPENVTVESHTMIDLVYSAIRRYIEQNRHFSEIARFGYATIDSDKDAAAGEIPVNAIAIRSTNPENNTFAEMIDYSRILRESCKTDDDRRLVSLLVRGLTIGQCAVCMNVSTKAIEDRRADIAARAEKAAPNAARNVRSRFQHTAEKVEVINEKGTTETYDSITKAAAAIGVCKKSVQNALKNEKPVKGFTIRKVEVQAAPPTYAAEKPRRYTEKPIDVSAFDSAMQLFIPRRAAVIVESSKNTDLRYAKRRICKPYYFECAHTVNGYYSKVESITKAQHAAAHKKAIQLKIARFWREYCETEYTILHYEYSVKNA